jgi:hypothetical protein
MRARPWSFKKINKLGRGGEGCICGQYCPKHIFSAKYDGERISQQTFKMEKNGEKSMG